MDLLFVDPGSNVCELKGVVEVCCVLCQLSVFILNIPNFSEWELIIIFFLVMLNTFFLWGALNQNVKVDHAVAGLFVSTANHPGGLTIGHSLWKLST